MLRAKAAPAETALRKHLDDSSGAVQVACAEALARLGKMDTALSVLERQLQQTQAPFFALQAANVLDRLGESARPCLPVLKQLLAKTEGGDANGAGGYLNRMLDRITAVLEGNAAALVYPETAKK